jgi:hypothetical protein
MHHWVWNESNDLIKIYHKLLDLIFFDVTGAPATDRNRVLGDLMHFAPTAFLLDLDSRVMPRKNHDKSSTEACFEVRSNRNFLSPVLR